jgi:hypothetical protein
MKAQDNFIAAIFDSKDRAVEFHQALANFDSQGLQVQRAGVYGHGVNGDVVLQDEETSPDALFDFLTGSSAPQQEAIDELSEKLPAGSFALLAHVLENDPNAVDRLALQYGGRVYRFESSILEASGLRRFTDASHL